MPCVVPPIGVRDRQTEQRRSVVDDRGGRPAELTGLRLEAELGRGADTTVYRAGRGGERYALKRSRDDVGNSTSMVTAMRREAALLACVEHPGVLRTYAA